MPDNEYDEINRLEGERDTLRSEVESLRKERASPLDRDYLGQLVRTAWVLWAKTQPNPKPSWLILWSDLPEADREADRQIGVAVSRYCAGIELLNAERERNKLAAEVETLRAKLKALEEERDEYKLLASQVSGIEQRLKNLHDRTLWVLDRFREASRRAEKQRNGEEPDHA